MQRETIVVVGKNRALDTVLKEFGCGIIRTEAEEVSQAIRRFIGEFRQGIPIAIIYGQAPDQASALAKRIKQACEGTRVIAISDVVGQATVDAEREYDVIIPQNPGDLRNAMGAFLSI